MAQFSRGAAPPRPLPKSSLRSLARYARKYLPPASPNFCITSATKKLYRPNGNWEPLYIKRKFAFANVYLGVSMLICHCIKMYHFICHCMTVCMCCLPLYHSSCALFATVSAYVVGFATVSCAGCTICHCINLKNDRDND